MYKLNINFHISIQIHDGRSVCQIEADSHLDLYPPPPIIAPHPPYFPDLQVTMDKSRWRFSNLPHQAKEILETTDAPKTGQAFYWMIKSMLCFVNDMGEYTYAYDKKSLKCIHGLQYLELLINTLCMSM